MCDFVGSSRFILLFQSQLKISQAAGLWKSRTVEFLCVAGSTAAVKLSTLELFLWIRLFYDRLDLIRVENEIECDACASFFGCKLKLLNCQMEI